MATKPYNRAGMFEVDLAKFNAAHAETIRFAKVEERVVIGRTAQRFAANGVRSTPMERKTVKVPRGPLKAEGKLFWTDEPAGTHKVRGRGLAKAGWLGVLDRLGAHGGGGAGISIGALIAGLRQSDVDDQRGRRDTPYIEIANEVPYIDTLDRAGVVIEGKPYAPAAHIRQKAMNRTRAQLEIDLTKMARKMESKWR